jgi:hypothetical protein
LDLEHRTVVEPKNRKAVIAQTIQGISECANLGVFTPEQYFDFCHTIVEATGDPDLREVQADAR